MTKIVEDVIKAEIGRLEDDAYRYRVIGGNNELADIRQKKADELKDELRKLRQ